MPNTAHTLLSRDSVPRRSQQPEQVTPVRGVVQDKPLPPTAPIASPQPDPMTNPHRADTTHTMKDRSQNLFTGKFKAVKTTSWMNPLVKAELDRIAKLWGVSLSKVIAVACEDWIHKSIRDQHEAMLYPVMRQVIREELRAFGDRIVHFLMFLAVAIEAARILITNVLDRILIFTGKPDEYASLVQRSDILARQKVSDKIPYLKTLVQKWNTNPTEKEQAKGES